jgi:hypothetical protein
MRYLLVLFLALALMGSSSSSWASSASTAAEVASSAGSALGTLVYAPFKATFSILGGIGSGFAAIAAPPTAGKVAVAACGGSWIVTPNVIRGRETLKFVGDTSPDRATAAR